MFGMDVQQLFLELCVKKICVKKKCSNFKTSVKILSHFKSWGLCPFSLNWGGELRAALAKTDSGSIL
jgi:hypothetical protein